MKNDKPSGFVILDASGKALSGRVDPNTLSHWTSVPSRAERFRTREAADTRGRELMIFGVWSVVTAADYMEAFGA